MISKTTLAITTLILVALSGVALGQYPSHAGGPDTFGYEYIDDQATGGPTYAFQDSSATGTAVTFSNVDDGIALVTLTQSFSLYGTAYTQLAFSTNGYLSTATTDSGGDLSNDWPLPASPSTGSGGRIYACHDDMYVNGGGSKISGGGSPPIWIMSSPEPPTIVVENSSLVLRT